MRRCGIHGLLIFLAAVGALAAGCGGGGESGAPSPASVAALGWDPPGTYSDNTALDPYQDLEYYEVYVREDEQFTDDDVPVALLKAVVDDPEKPGVGKKLEKEFVLNNIGPYVEPGKLYYVSLKAVGVDGQRSAFMIPVSWDQRAVLPL